ncbi:MAG: hypothetical protein JWM74_1920 [Myxococcaceae bacterium]|nr:hypothetical protein [Myxococcaceae bacterium]
MWARGAAIRPVPEYAKIDARLLEQVERDLSDTTDAVRVDLDAAFVRFESTQPQLSDRVTSVLGRPLDETALALGYFLAIAVWLAFERAFPDRLDEVTEEALKATEDALALEEELRASHSEEPLEIDDVVAQEQPALIDFVHGHLEAALEGKDDEPREVDIDDVHLVYRTVLVLALALSHAVRAPGGDGSGIKPRNDEMMA